MTTAGEPNNGGGSPCLSVIVLERDPLVREGLRELLRGWNIQVLAISGPDTALWATPDSTPPHFAIVAAPDGNAAAGAAWIAAVHARYDRLPIIFVADRPAAGATPAGCVRIDWPVRANRLREAVADVVACLTAQP